MPTPNIEVTAPVEVHSENLRLDFLDGLRGLAALFVVLHHMHQETTYTVLDHAALPPRLLSLTSWLELGHYGVAVFIVLSGYSLMLPVVRSGTGQLKGGFGRYIQRRARRILPPYYIALAISLLLFAIVPALHHPQGTRIEADFPAWEPNAIWTHLLLVHNLTPWTFKINGPMWSVATEWQIYFLFPLLLLPVWKRFGSVTAVIVGFGLGLAPHLLFNVGDGAYPWYIGLFAMGMMGAALSFSRHSGAASLLDKMPWLLLSLLCTLGLIVTIKKWHGYAAPPDALAGAATMCLLVGCAYQFQQGRNSLLLRFFRRKGLVQIGLFSYSLYLIDV